MGLNEVCSLTKQRAAGAVFEGVVFGLLPQRSLLLDEAEGTTVPPQVSPRPRLNEVCSLTKQRAPFSRSLSILLMPQRSLLLDEAEGALFKVVEHLAHASTKSAP